MSFDAERFCEDYGIDIPARNSNCADGWINIKCPHCDDKSNHLGINIATGQVHCWRCKANNLIKTIQALCSCSIKGAFEIKEKYSIVLSEEEYGKIEYYNEQIEVPGSKLLSQHKDYLRGRNFDPDFLENKYDLRGTLMSDLYSYRIIAPIYYNNQIISYQGRDFTGQQKSRYMTCRPKNEIIHHHDILYNLDNCKKNSVIVVEGVYDVMRLGDNSCATFGISYKQEQVALLAKRFKKVFMMYDGEPQAQESALQICKELSLVGVETINIKLDQGDPAELSNNEVYKIKEDFKLL